VFTPLPAITVPTIARHGLQTNRIYEKQLAWRYDISGYKTAAGLSIIFHLCKRGNENNPTLTGRPAEAKQSASSNF
jgi:hypothetical protein